MRVGFQNQQLSLLISLLGMYPGDIMSSLTQYVWHNPLRGIIPQIMHLPRTANQRRIDDGLILGSLTYSYIVYCLLGNGAHVAATSQPHSYISFVAVGNSLVNPGFYSTNVGWNLILTRTFPIPHLPQARSISAFRSRDNSLPNVSPRVDKSVSC